MADFNAIAKKWQKRWEESSIFNVKKNSSKKKFYILEMYPYPSGSGLHMGHARNYCIGDCYARFKRMNNFNVLYPMGYDSFGLPAENAAIKAKSHPRIFTEKAIKNFIRQQKGLGLSYDWTRIVETHKPDYYKWDQWIFLKMYEKGLAYKRKSPVKWCPECNTVLANEQVHDNKCWRHTDTEVEQKELDQWYFKITDYAEELLQDIDKLGWSEDVKIMQRNWIGKSHGVDILFKLENGNKILPTFTTRCDTIFSVTFIVIAPEHPLAKEIVKGTQYEEEFNKTLKIISKQSIIERTTPEGKDKIGCFLGKYAINPVNNERVPLYVANFVLMDYGTGIVMADAHDQRDFEFARKYNIPLKFVISHDGSKIDANKANRAYLADGVLFDSGKFSGLHNRTALPMIADWMDKNGFAKKTVNYKLKDWLISRQRFWGTPIPIIYCGKCGIVPLPEKDIPVKLPEKIKFESAKNPLVDYEPFVNAKCPKCSFPAKRETDTMDTFVNSSWYFLRYCDPKNAQKIFSPEKAAYWMPIDQYIGGKEHACMHLIYFRFYTKFLRDLGLLKFGEPAGKLFNQGMLHGSDGAVMSKSRGNVVLPEEVSGRYGIDTARLFLLFVAGPDKDMAWSDKGVEGSFKFLNKFFSLLDRKITEKEYAKQESKVNRIIKETTENINNFKFNLAIINLMELANYLYLKEEINKSVLERLVKMMSIFTPHICEEMWEKLGNKGFVSLAAWPGYDRSKIDEAAEAEEENISGLISDINRVVKLAELEKPKKITLFVAERWKYKFFRKLKKVLAKTRNIGEIIKECIDSEHKEEISKMVPKLIKNESKLPKVVLDRKKELKSLQDNKEYLSRHLNADIKVMEADASGEKKARQAMPSKPAILVE
ncbi:leucine--tRNA ligase [Candidatus Woesearchaeota archaeon]|nr:leucine--tRNA ligase [Candidatus Woesearchaeota archaeon]